MYNIFNSIFLTCLVVLANIEQTYSPWLAVGFVMVDSTNLILFPNLNKNITRRNQILLHHLATYIICAIFACGGTEPYDIVFPAFLNLEISSLFIIGTKYYKKLKWISYPFWVLSRMIYLPIIMIYTFNMNFVNLPNIMIYIYQFFTCIIYGLGITWTFEMFKININPLVVTHVSSLLPVLNASTNVVTTTVGYMLLLSGILHHTWWKIGNFYHIFDVCMCYLYILVTFSFDPLYLICLFGVLICYMKNKEHPDRSWKNIKNHIPHMLMLFLSGMGVFNILI